MTMKSTFLNVKLNLEHVVSTCNDMLERDGKHEDGLRLAPIDRDNLAHISFLCRAILRKNAAKNKETGQRKDIYVNKK